LTAGGPKVGTGAEVAPIAREHDCSTGADGEIVEGVDEPFYHRDVEEVVGRSGDFNYCDIALALNYKIRLVWLHVERL
jgi:hypothetical protein